VSTWYLYFLTDVVKINPGLAGTAFLVSKLWDAVTDPFEGVLTDRTRTRLGRRRPSSSPAYLSSSSRSS
jgi:Na+/melibiose symporter-like transporter